MRARKNGKTDHDRKLKPESLMMSYGYNPEWSEGAIKSPIFQTSTFAFPSAEQGKAFFEVAYGLREQRPKEKSGLIYSRINNPDLEILEDRLTLWDEAEDCAVFESGMGAITTAFLEFLKPGDLILMSAPLYGGTDHFIQAFLPKIGIESMEFKPSEEPEAIARRLEASGKSAKLAMIFIETPANPTNALIDIAACRGLADRFSRPDRRILIAVDNTYMGPLWQHPLKHGADLVLYSATKYIGGHSDVIAGACLGSKELIHRVKVLRTFLGNMAGPMTGWLLMRSLETLKVRMERQAANAQEVAAWLTRHPKVGKVYYLGLLTAEDGQQYRIYKQQHNSPGAMMAFDVKRPDAAHGASDPAADEAAAFRFLNRLKLIKLAVSLGSTESLAEHPATMTHIGVEEHHRAEMNITNKLIRLSVGVEDPQDLIWDIGQALEAV
ncbi:MAG: cystathionine gamma-synthase family protein [Fibrobacteres bacterium]|nr:cystathionine gamma-synthase family protein [Fibrobacterota bacterium]